MNAISFTQTRSTLSSADLRLSESLVKPSHVMNVEASQHSPSVTVSIFDALADILTSTPRIPRLSSTTEVQQNQKNNKDTKQTLDGVSNNVNVNSVEDLANLSTFVATNIDANINTKSVQITAQTTPNVINIMSGETTPSLNTDRENLTPVNTPTIPFPIPTTPVSARRPFAFKVLYSDTEPPTDKLSTATEPTSYQSSTDPSTVYNTVSDLLLTNNNLVSSELTSMLSNNIRDIIKNMDADSRSRLSVDMARLLKNLIPRALDRLTTVNDDIDVVLNTTPYSLEEIKDTENIDVNITDSNSTSIEALQTTRPNIANSTRYTSIISSISLTDGPIQAVNSSSETQRLASSTLPVLSSQTTLAESALPNFTLTTLSFNNVMSTTSITPPNTTPITDKATSSVSLDTDTITVDSNIQNRFGDSSKNSTNNNVPLPFFTNPDLKEIFKSNPENVDNVIATTQVKPIILTTKSVTPSRDVEIIDSQGSSQVSPIQLLVLSKKAKVLQMIEDLIRQHHNELATVTPLTDVLIQENNIPLSDRLTQIINTMSTTTESTDITNDGESTSPMTTPFPPPFPISFDTKFPSSGTFENVLTTTLTTSEPTITINDVTSATTESSVLSNRFSNGSTSTSGMKSSIDIADANPNTTPLVTTVQVSNRAGVDFTNVEKLQTTTQGNIETNTASGDTEITTTNIDTTTDIVDTTQTDIDMISTTAAPETKQNLVSVVNSNQLDVTEKPKKDYVIFGILPNNTVVRKDPNDDILESLTEASPYIIFGVLPNNTVIRRFPNGTRVPRVMQKIDVLPISPWSLRNPYSPIHNNPAIVRPQSNPIRVSTNIVTSTDTSDIGTENRLTNDTVNNQQTMVLTLRCLA